MATGEIRLSILWEWLHKRAAFTEADAATGVKPGHHFTRELFDRLLEAEYDKLIAASDRDVHEDSKLTTLPIAFAIVKAYVGHAVKAPWYIDLLNLNLDRADITEAERRIRAYFEAFDADGRRITANPDFARAGAPVPLS